jgi:hypothetical protein
MSARSATTIDELSPKYNIYLSTKEKKAVDDVNAYQGYIINMNDKMKREYDEMKDELTAASNLLADRDYELDREEKNVINMRGVIQNLKALNQLNQKIKNQYICYQKHTADILKYRNEQARAYIVDHLVFITVTTMLVLVLWYLDIISMHHMVFHISWHIADFGIIIRAKHTRLILQNGKSNYIDGELVVSQANYVPKIKRYTDEINALVKANDNLFDYIDGI